MEQAEGLRRKRSLERVRGKKSGKRYLVKGRRSWFLFASRFGGGKWSGVAA